MIRKLLLLLVLGALFAPSLVQAQGDYVRLSPTRKHDTLSSSGDYIVFAAENVGGFGSITIQTMDSYTGIWEVQCSVKGQDPADFDADSELTLVKKDDPTAVYEVTSTVGIWTVTNASGCRFIRVIATSGFSGTDTEVYLEATQTGGAGGSGGGGTVTLEGDILAGAQPATDPHYVRCSNGSAASPCLVGDGTGPLTVDGTVTVTDGAGALNVIVDSGTITAVTSITNPVTVTDGAGALNVIIDSATLGTVTVSDGSGAMNTIVDSGTLTAVTTITNPVTVTDGAGALNVIIDSGTSAVTQSGTWNMRLQDGSGNAVTSAVAGSFRALTMHVVDSSGNIVSSFGGAGGTSSAFGATFPSGAGSGTAVGFLDAGGLMAAARVVDADTSGTTYNVLGVNLVTRTSGTPVEAFTSSNAGYVQFATAQAVTGTLTVTDGAGAMNVIVDSGTLTAVTSITNPVTVTDGAGSLNVIVDSGTLTAVTAITNPVTVTDGAGALNTIVDSGTITTVTTVTTVSNVPGTGVENSAETDGSVLYMMGGVRRDTAVSSTSTSGFNATLNLDAVGRLWTSGATAEDTASANLDQGLAVFAIRDDTLDVRSTTEGDYEPFHTNANGALWVVDVNSTTQGTSLTTIASGVGTEDAAAADARGLAMMGSVRTDTAASSTVTNGDIAWLITDSLGRLWVTGSAVEDAAETAGGILNMAGAVVRTTPTGSSVTNGDNATLNVDGVGALWVNPFSQTQAAATYLTVRLSDGSSFLAPGTDYTHDGPLTLASTAGPALIGNFDDSSTDSVDEGDAGVLRISANRNLYQTIRDAAGNERGVNVTASNELLVNCGNCTGSGATHIDDAPFTPASDDGTVAFATFDDVAPDSVNEGDGGALRMSVNRNLYVTIRDAAGNERGLNIDSSGQLATTISAGGFPDNEPFNVQQWAGTTAVAGGTAGAPAVGGIQAHGAVLSGNNPVLVGAYASTTAPSAESAADLTRLWAGLNGQLAVMLVDSAGAAVAVAGGTQYTQDVALTVGTTVGTMAMGRASAAAPTDVSAGNDAVLPWYLLSGAQVTQPTYGGVLAVAGNGGVGTGVQRVTLANDSTGVLATVSTVTNLSQFGGAAINLGVGTVGTGTLRMVIASDDPVNDAAVKFDAQMVADDAASAGNPIYVGGLATSSIVGQTPVTTADRVGFVGGLDRVQIERPHANLEDRLSGVAAITSGASTQVIAAQAAGVRICATTLIVSNSSATNVTVDIRDGTGGSVLATVPAAANMGGAVIQLAVPLCTTAATELAADPSAAATTVAITAIGFKTEL